MTDPQISPQTSRKLTQLHMDSASRERRLTEEKGNHPGGGLGIALLVLFAFLATVIVYHLPAFWEAIS